jgi:hypothetical protein
MTLLCLFNEATILTQADQTITISIVGPILLNLLSDLELERKKSERVYLLCDALISSLKTRFGGFYKHFSIETDYCAVKIKTNANTSCLYSLISNIKIWFIQKNKSLQFNTKISFRRTRWHFKGRTYD